MLVTFEAETRGIAKEYGTDKFETVVPPVSILAEFPVSVVDKVVDKRGSRAISENYLNYLYSPEGQEILATFGNRVHDKGVVEKFKDQFPDVRLLTVDDVFGGWAKVSKEEFGPGGTVDQLLAGR